MVLNIRGAYPTPMPYNVRPREGVGMWEFRDRRSAMNYIRGFTKHNERIKKMGLKPWVFEIIHDGTTEVVE